MINGLKDIIDTFDTFILDQWGVLHNGGNAFPEAIEALTFLKSHNKKVSSYLTVVKQDRFLTVA